MVEGAEKSHLQLIAGSFKGRVNKKIMIFNFVREFLGRVNFKLIKHNLIFAFSIEATKIIDCLNKHRRFFGETFFHETLRDDTRQYET